MKGFKSITRRTVVIIIPLLVLILGSINFYTYIGTKDGLTEQVEQRMENRLNSVEQFVENSLLENSKIPELIARQIEVAPTDLSLKTYEDTLKRTIPTNESTYGGGVFFEPFQYDKDEEYFSTFAYRDGDKIKTTDKYSDPAFDYTSQDWYQVATDTEEDVIYTRPYLDTNVDVSMVTATAPFYDNKEKFLGVVTSDIDLTDIQQVINDIEVEKTGYAFLIDDEGRYIADQDSSKMMELKITEDPNEQLASFGEQIVAEEQSILQFENNSLFTKKMEGTGWTIGLVVPDQELYAALSTLTLKQIVVSIIGIALIIIVVMLYSRWIVRNVNDVKNMAQTIASGDLTQTMQVNSEDEFGQLAEATNQMKDNLRSIVDGITNASETITNHSHDLTISADGVGEASEQVAATMQELASGAETQANVTGDLATMMARYATQIQQTNDSGEAIRVSSLDVLEMTEEGTQLMNSSNEQMMQIEQVVQDAVTKMSRLDTETQEISKLVGVIQDVAEQTNLLALNAAIEAARAGESGKGFAVVADEVRKLAEQVATSITDITGFVTNIQNESGSVSHSLKNGYTEVELGMTQIQATGETFNQISSSVTDMVDKIKNMAGNLSDIASSSEEMNDSVENIATVSEDSAAGIEQTSAASEETTSSMNEIVDGTSQLEKLAEELNELTHQFKL